MKIKYKFIIKVAFLSGILLMVGDCHASDDIGNFVPKPIRKFFEKIGACVIEKVDFTAEVFQLWEEKQEIITAGSRSSAKKDFLFFDVMAHNTKVSMYEIPDIVKDVLLTIKPDDLEF
ncbi:MAG: hypothetical protein NTX76_06355 [Alphaproteobacteria bacterium]|nr:hypothetical protein [Alphaproteobacteria bacterium]